MKENYNETLKWLNALQKQKRDEESAERRAEKRVEMVRMLSQGSSGSAESGNTGPERFDVLGGLNININGDINITHNINYLMDGQQDGSRSRKSSLDGDQSKRIVKNTRKLESSSLTEKIFNNDKIMQGREKFTFKPLNMQTVIEDEYAEGKSP